MADYGKAKKDGMEDYKNEKEIGKVLLSARMTRRRALSTAAKVAVGAGVVVVVAGGAAAYFASRPPSTLTTTSISTATSTATATATTTATATATTTATQTLTQTATSSTSLPPPMGPIQMDVWGYHPEIVQKSIDAYAAEYNDKVSLSVVAGDWEAAMETRFIAGVPVDVAYANPFHAIRWYKAGWIRSLEDIQANSTNIPYSISQMKADMYDGVRASWTAPDGSLLALPYFTSDRGNIVTNEKILSQAGFSGLYPSTWPELYDQLRKIKAKGVTDTPYLPHWFAEWFGIAWGFLFEVENQGGPDALFNSKTFEATFDTNTLAAEVLKDWQSAWNDGLVPKSVLTMAEPDFIAAFNRGTYAYSPQQTYDAVGTFNTPSISPIAGQVNLVPAVKQPWGLLDEGGYVLSNRPRRPDDLVRAQSYEAFMGYKDKKTGSYFVAKQWALVSFLNSGYPGILQDPDVIAGYEKQLGADRAKVMLDTINGLYKVIQQPHIWKAFWYTDWQTKANQVLPDVVQGKTTVQDGITTLRKYAQDLLSKYSA